MTGKHQGRARQTVFIAVTLFLSATEVSAQTVDYGSLQELFGEPVTTTATGKPQKSSEVPVAMEIVTADQIRRMGVTSLPEVLNRVPGLTSWQATRSWADVGVRGQNTGYNPTLLVLLNGRQVYIDIYGYTDWSLIPVQLEEIRQVEVVKGPSTALYGFNAVDGVVNIVTYNPKYDAKSQAGLVAGMGQYGRGYGIGTFKLSERASVRFSASAERFDEFDRRSETDFVANSFASNGGDLPFKDSRMGKFMADGLFQVNDNTQLRLEGSIADGVGNDAAVGFLSYRNDKSFASGKASLISDTTDWGLVEANIYLNDTSVEYGPSLDLSIDNQVIVAQLQDLFKVGTSHSFRLQGEYRHNEMTSQEITGPGAEVSYDVLAVGGMWNWVIVPRLEWTNSLRLDYLMLDRSGPLNIPAPFTGNSDFDQNIADYSINSGMVWKATDLDTLRASFGRGIQAPSLVQLGITAPFPGGIVYVGDPRLEPTVVEHYEIGYDRLVKLINGKFRSSLFYRRTKDISALSASNYFAGANFITQSGVIGDSDTRGFELGFEGKIKSDWTWDVSYIYQTTIDDLLPVAAILPSPVWTRYENTVPQHMLKGHLGYASGPWESDLYGEIASSFDANVATVLGAYSVQRLDGYYTLGGRVGYTFDNSVTMALHGSELAQARVTNNYGLENERRVFLSLSKKF